MPRFYCPPPLTSNKTFELPPNAAHHAARVLRLREGDKVEIFDGAGKECGGVIVELSGKRVVVGNITTTDTNRESPLQILLAQALVSSEKMDWVIQKGTELGVAEIQPLNTERSVVRLTTERAAKRVEHWRQVAIAACEQCNRNVLPRIHAPMNIIVWLQQMRGSPITKLILSPEGNATMHQQVQPQHGVVLLIGAEGGFAAAENDAALLCGFAPIRMGTRVLRTETAAIAGLAALQVLWGDF